MLELALAATLVMAALLLVVTWLSLRWQRAWLLEEAERGVLLASDAVESSLRMGMMQNAREEVLASIQQITRRTQIERIRLIEHRGRIGMSTSQADLGRQVAPGSASCTICHRNGGANTIPVSARDRIRAVVEDNRIRAFTPVLAEPGCVTAACHQRDKKSGVLGVIDISLSLNDVEQDLARLRFRLVVLSAATIALGGALIWFALARRFRSPMEDLLRGIRRVAAGDLSHRIPERSSDEFGELARSFNVMSRQLSDVQQSLIQSERLISMGKLAAGVAHEINNPLTGILSYAEDLLARTTPGDPHREDYEVIVREALRCRQIVRGLLDFARQDPASPALVRPGDILEKAVDVVVRQSVFRNIKFEREVAAELPRVLADPVQMEQVLINLIVNAQQAMPNGGVITLGVRSADGGNRVEFSVRDEGTGIPPEIRSRIFDPFFSTKGGKTDGLGLAVCLGIVRQHGGKIDFESEPGRGTIFRVALATAGAGQRGEENATEG